LTGGTYTSGNPGMGFYMQGASGVNSDFGFTSFMASDTGAGGVQPLLHIQPLPPPGLRAVGATPVRTLSPAR